MWENAKAELDAVFQKNNTIMFERRGSSRWSQFRSHLGFLQSYAAIQNRVIRPVMVNFGSYVDGMGHMHFIESAEELVEGYLLPISRISFHILLNGTGEAGGVSHSLTFKTDSTRAVCAYRKSGGYGTAKSGFTTHSRFAVGRFDLTEITPELVEAHLKDFLIDAVLARPQQMMARADRHGSVLTQAG